MRQLKPGTLVRIIYAPDQGQWERSFIGKIGIVIERLTRIGPNKYNILLCSGAYEIFHALDLEELSE